MTILTWCSQRLGALSMFALLALCYWVISRESLLQRSGYKTERSNIIAAPLSSSSTSGAGIWTFVFAYYCLFIHILVFFVPLRACWAVWDITRAIKRRAQSKAMEDYKKPSLHRRASCVSVASSETLTSDANGCSSTASEASDFDPDIMYADRLDISRAQVIHAIIIPNYKEELDTLKETLDVLASHPQARTCYDVYLGMEQREIGSEAKALGLIQEFVKRFRSIDYALHPTGIPGEAAGKGSNLAWAARTLSSKYPLTIRKNVVVTGIDADSHLSHRYFADVSSLHLSHPETASTTLYAPPVIFDRNAHQVPGVVRVADIMWCAAGLSGLYSGSTIAPPTSVYSLPLELVDRVGGWDCGSEAIGEDLHMFLKCFFALNGNLTCRTILCPVSQSNVTAGAGGGIRGAFADIRARYKQALRHMWGALDSGFALCKTIEMWKERKHTSRAFRPLHRTIGSNTDFYFPDSHTDNEDHKVPVENGIFSDVTQETIKEPHWELVFYLCHRLFEAHFLPVHMAILVFASALFVWVSEGNGDPNNLSWMFTASTVLRTMGFMGVACYVFLYESYHRVCVNAREREMKRAGIAEGMHFSRRSFRNNFLDYILLPIVAPLYGTIPCAQAEISHLWTVNLQYAVSKKATRQAVKSLKAGDVV